MYKAEAFINDVDYHINKYIPKRYATVYTKVLIFMTSLTKQLLRKHNKLMTRGLFNKAD